MRILVPRTLGAVVFFFLLFQVLFSLPIFAIDGVLEGESLGTNPKSRSVDITALVRDRIAPSVPILISPENSSTLTTNLITFVWQGSTDPHGIKKYQLYLNGSLYLDNISPFDQTTTAYALTKTDDAYALVLKNTIAEGFHTWKIRVFDTNDNITDSATWSFTIDTVAPVLVVTEIGGYAVSISSQDSTTIPTDAIRLTENEPTLKGGTEANAQVTLTITIPGKSPEVLTVSADSNGGYSFTLPILPRGIRVYLQILAIDPAGNTSVIDGIPLLILEQQIIVPEPYSKIIPPITTPTLKEIRNQVLDVLEKTLEAIEKIIPIPLQAKQFVSFVVPFFNLFIGLLIPLSRFSVALWLTGAPIWMISFETLKRIAQSVGLWVPLHFPPIAQQLHGMVFNQETYQPIPFALVAVLKTQSLDSSMEIVEETVCDDYGRYTITGLDPSQQYTLQLYHRDYLFDKETAQDRFFGIHDMYYGQWITAVLCKTKNNALSEAEQENLEQSSLKNDKDGLYGVHCLASLLFISLLIPMEDKVYHTQGHHSQAVLQKQLVHHLRKNYWYTHLPSPYLFMLTLIMGFLAFLSPSLWNIGMAGVYASVLIKKGVREKRYS